MKPIPHSLIALFILVTLIGFADATYLTVKHYQGIAPPCSLLQGCEVVTTSTYATIGPIPLSLVGSLYYLFLFIASIAYFDTKREIVIRIAAYATTLGLLTSAVLVYLQLFVISAICLYCMGSAVTSTFLFILGIIILKKLQKNSTVALSTMPPHELMIHN
jgi:uncharacterized membrane protein